MTDEIISDDAITAAFGAVNRARLLRAYFAEAGQPSPEDAWLHLYRLLFWTDRTTGLVHGYESDKCQPGKTWYPRMLAVHSWLANVMKTTPVALGASLDWMFRRVTEQLAETVVRARRATIGHDQRSRHGAEFPEPGHDPIFEKLVVNGLADWLTGNPPAEVMHALTERVREHFGLENKRKNLIGEGFEDALAFIIASIAGKRLDVRTRVALHALPGFYEKPDKPPVVDIAIIMPNGRRIIIAAKWSLRSDRERQLYDDFREYTRLNANTRQGFDYVFITNEFDPARLASTCDATHDNALVFRHVVHLNPEGPLVAYAVPVKRAPREKGGILATTAHAKSGRLSSLATWLAALTT